MPVQQRFYIETLGCPKNDVDSDKIVGTLLADGLAATDSAQSVTRTPSPVNKFFKTT